MEKSILLWLPLQGDVQWRHISPESYIVIICKLISTCDLMRRGFSPERPGRARLKDAVPGRLGGGYYITVLYGKPVTNGDSIRTLIAFLNFSLTHKTKISTWQTCRLPRGVPEVHDIVLPIYCRQQQNYSASLAQNNLDWSSRRGEIGVKNGFKNLNSLCCILWDYIWSVFFNYNFTQVW